MPDRQILGSGSKAAPLDYKLPPSVALQLKAVRAVFADNTASGDWLPCVDLISDSGDILARAADQNAKVTAGGNADVSWFPGVKNGSSTGGGVGTMPFVNISIGNHTFPNLGEDVAFDTNNNPTYDTSVFTVNLNDAFNPVVFLKAGLYWVTWSLIWPTGAGYADIQTAFGTMGGSGFFLEGTTGGAVTATSVDNGQAGSYPRATQNLIQVSIPPVGIKFPMRQLSGGNVVGSAHASVLYIATNTH